MALAVNSKPQNDGEIQEMIDIFHRFDVVSDESDHHYANTNNNNRPSKNNINGGDSFINVSSGVHKKIMQEWKILEKNLPDSIFVRVYENRIDLLRAVIVGAAGTPYHDGLFFFDFAFPPDYPTRPPLVHYRSYGLRLNPNLYANGRVCLSLINTWAGKKSEKWNPSESTVLQVLVSVQALVLNEKPYFNEPGHGMWPGRAIWEKKSMAYSEDVFVLSCKTMMYLLRRPPKNFEGFVAAHFRERAHLILLACKAYFDGKVRLGYFITNEVSSSSSGSTSFDVSAKFKGLMEQLYPEMVAAFSRNGASLGNFVEHLTVERKTAPCKGQVVVVKKKKKKTKERGIARKMFGELKRVLGLNKKNNADSLDNKGK